MSFSVEFRMWILLKQSRERDKTWVKSATRLNAISKQLANSAACVPSSSSSLPLLRAAVVVESKDENRYRKIRM
jgi:hypothetical protein